MNKFFSVSVFTLALTSVQMLTAQSTLAATLLKSFTSTLTSDQEVPPITSTANGTAQLQLFETSPNNFLLTYSMTVNGIDFDPMADAVGGTPLGIPLIGNQAYKLHMHNAARGANGPVAFDIVELDLTNGSIIQQADKNVQFTNQGIDSWFITGDLDSTEGLTQSFVDQFLNTPDGQDAPFYFNIHTAQLPNGEIRGQIVAAVPESSNLLGLAGIGGISLLALRRKQN